MKDSKDLTKSTNNPIFDFFFHLTYLSPASEMAFAIIWIIEKLIILGPLLLLIFNGTDWNVISNITQNFNVIIPCLKQNRSFHISLPLALLLFFLTVFLQQFKQLFCIVSLSFIKSKKA